VCTFCLTEKDTSFYLMYQGECTQLFWARSEKWLIEKSSNCDRLSINRLHILLGHDGKAKTDEGVDFILLHADIFVYKCRLNKLKPTLEAFQK